jgi:hypothetical protein
MSLAKLWTFGVVLKLGIDLLLPLSRLGVVPAASVGKAALDAFVGAFGLIALGVGGILWRRTRAARQRLRLASMRDALRRRRTKIPSWPPARYASWQ